MLQIHVAIATVGRAALRARPSIFSPGSRGALTAFSSVGAADADLPALPTARSTPSWRWRRAACAVSAIARSNCWPGAATW
jgi:hypothetical protein